jgi:hypothetical protein
MQKLPKIIPFSRLCSFIICENLTGLRQASKEPFNKAFCLLTKLKVYNIFPSKFPLIKFPIRGVNI